MTGEVSVSIVPSFCAHTEDWSATVLAKAVWVGVALPLERTYADEPRPQLFAVAGTVTVICDDAELASYVPSLIYVAV
jgi:hypothetical protein